MQRSPMKTDVSISKLVEAAREPLVLLHGTNVRPSSSPALSSGVWLTYGNVNPDSPARAYVGPFDSRQFAPAHADERGS